MSDNPKHVTVRLRVPPELRDKISASSEQYNRSMNADMVARLEESFSSQDNESLEMHLTMQAYKDQSKELKELKEMVLRLLERS